MNSSVITNSALFASVVVLSIVLTRGMISLAHERGWVVKPKADRWSQTPTALYGGVAIVAAFAVGAAAALLRPGTSQHFDILGLFAGGTILFALGVRDDFHPLNPLVKLVQRVVGLEGKLNQYAAGEQFIAKLLEHQRVSFKWKHSHQEIGKPEHASDFLTRTTANYDIIISAVGCITEFLGIREASRPRPPTESCRMAIT